MHAVHSLFTEPVNLNRWPTVDSFFRAFALSAVLAERHMGAIELVTDSYGAELLAEAMRLPYRRVSTTLNAMHGRYHPEFWTLGKIAAYAEQTKPFVHIDGDWFMLKPLSPEVLNAPIAYQSKEAAPAHSPGVYKIALYERLGMAIPPSWRWCLASTGANQYAANMGLYACRNLILNRAYCREAFAFVDAQANQPVFERMVRERVGAELWEVSVSVEQFTAVSVARKAGVNPAYVVPEYWEPTWGGDPAFVHLFWKYKGMAHHEAEVARRLHALAPEYIARAEHAAKTFERMVAAGRFNGRPAQQFGFAGHGY